MPHEALLRGKRFEIINHSGNSYPLPCPGCNTVVQRDNISFESCIEEGLAELVDGVLVQYLHIPICPFGHAGT
jgi:hypothetical protein